MSRFLKQTETALTLTRQNNPYALHNRLLLSTGDVEAVDVNGNTPLLVAAHNGYAECMAELLQLGHANFRQINVFGQNALTLATYAGSEPCVHQLLAKWTYDEYTAISLTPPLCVAAMRGHLGLVRKFSAMYPSPEHIHTVHAVDALMLALINGHKEVCDYLQQVAQHQQHQQHHQMAPQMSGSGGGLHLGRTPL